MAMITGTMVAENLEQEDPGQLLLYGIPAPFPVDRLVDLSDNEVLHELALERVEYDASEAPRNPRGTTALKDIEFSIATVQQSCFVTLANLLSLSTVMSPSALGLASEELFAGSSTTTERSDMSALAVVEPWSMRSSLAALVHALRTRDGVLELERTQPCSSGELIQDKTDEEELLAQLHDLVEMLAPSMRGRHTLLAQAIVELLVLLQQLPASFALVSPSSCSPSSPRSLSKSPSVSSISTMDGPRSVLTTLRKKLSSFQPTATASTTSATSIAPRQSIQPTLLWARISEQLETVMALCKACPSEVSGVNGDNPFCGPGEVSEKGGIAADATGASTFHQENHPLPPRYEDQAEAHHDDMPPAYFSEQTDCQAYQMFSDDKKPLSDSSPSLHENLDAPSTSLNVLDREKSAKLDLDLVTRAIDRLYQAAPQLTNQRVELRRGKVRQMKKAQQKGKGKLPEDSELDKMMDLLGRASTREIAGQRAVIDPRRSVRVKGEGELAEQRKSYIEHIMQRSSVGRLRSQDAEPSLALQASSPFSLSVNSVVLRSEVDAETSSSEEAMAETTSKIDTLAVPSDKKLRTRSVSAPHLAWLRSASRDRSGTSGSLKDVRVKSSSSSVKRLSGKLSNICRPSPSNDSTMSGALNIVYMAEHHEMLKHVLVFIALGRGSSVPVSSMGMLTAEVLPGIPGVASGDWLHLRLSGTPSPPLVLPVPVALGPRDVLVRNMHWEIKLSCSPQSSATATNAVNGHDHSSILSNEGDDPLLTASQLTSLSPILYTCMSCRLSLISSPSTRYHDLPSEHWEELVDAWMCHPEGQTLAKSKMHSRGAGGRGFGFWPAPGEALVGGSYLLFAAEAVTSANLKEVAGGERDDNPCSVQCICAATVGRCYEQKQEDGSVVRMYKFFKYSIRPISLTAESPQIPMSAFIVRDMLEHVQAHATYRFIFFDEEEERPRLLIWLFKPKLRISYMLASPSLLPRSGCVNASKVLYKILDPCLTDVKKLLGMYPGFPQAEYLFYPMDVCRKLTALLSESTGAYPESLRRMTGLDVGWLSQG